MTQTADGILIEQNRLLYSNSMMPIIVSVIASLLLSGSVWSIADHTVIVLWSSLFIIISLIRLRLLVLFDSQQTVMGNQNSWHSRFLIGNYAIAILWGTSSFLFFPEQSLSHQIVFILIIIGMAAGGVASLCSSFSILTGYLSLILFPLIFQLLLIGSAASIFKSFLLALFWAVTVAGGKKINLNIRENIQLRLQSTEREKIHKINEERYRHIFTNAPLGILHYKANGTIIDCNEELVRILGSSKELLIGFNMLTMLQDDMLLRALKESLKSGEGYYEGDYTSITSKTVTPVRAFFKKIKHSDQKELGGICIVEDFTEKRQSEDLVRYHASYDSLTELPNRRLLLEYLESEISRAKRHSHYGALLYLDLDNFKTINDSLGHSVGDELLKTVAKRLREFIRREDIASRMGGDEFTIVFTELDKERDVAASKVNVLAQELSLCLSSPCQIEGRNLQTTVSIGISMFPKDDKDVGDILKQADTAMYRAKAAGRNELCFFLPDMQDAADQKLQISTELRQAIHKNELVIYFQPQVDITGFIVGAEALVRWQHPMKGLMPPGLFLPIAEETGLVQNIDRWVLQEACHKIKHWTVITLNCFICLFALLIDNKIVYLTFGTCRRIFV